jgi:hypothetical protein
MSIVRRPFIYERDLDRTRAFLSEVYNRDGILHYLIPTKIENQKYGPCGPDYSPEDDAAFKIWTPSEGKESDIVALSHRGSAGNYHIEIHPDHKAMEGVLLHQIEDLERERISGKESRIYMYTAEPDTQRASTLENMGYEDYGLHEYNYMLPLDAPVPNNKPPEGFTVRCLRGEEDYPGFIDVVGSVFEHCGENMTVEKMRWMAKAEFYSQDLHLVAEDGDGEFVAFCMYRLDPLTRIAEMEALGVRKEVLDIGLEETLLSEGARRVMKQDPRLLCSVEVDVRDSLNHMLESAGFVRTVAMNMWGKTIT